MRKAEGVDFVSCSSDHGKSPTFLRAFSVGAKTTREIRSAVATADPKMKIISRTLRGLSPGRPDPVPSTAS